MNTGIWWRVGFMIGVMIGAALLLLYMTLWAPRMVVLVPAGPPATPTPPSGVEMTLYAKTGSTFTQLTKTAATAKTAAHVEADPLIKINEDLFEGARPDGTAFPEGRMSLRFPAGSVVRKSVFDRCFPSAVVESVFPASGAAAGGTNLIIRGRNFTPGSTVAIGGTTATDVVVVDDTTVQCKSPAHAAGAVAVVVTTDAGATTKANSFTYA
ncbi:IPT/TIG domain-containing protein [Nonomuraea candida]|uniref:IPT/TIG domain-containing protein n=1 Tax=Nonomuraea candida TaxID=359159 RepID=UPI0005BA587C|nr:IPT/TIG domain-containing protein [Nonomuraea candida]